MNETAKIFAIDRLRVDTDGHGVRTLVCSEDCLLKCKYCINYERMKADSISKSFSPKSLLDQLKIDDIYFKASGGGITFGGGEPALESIFIKEFKKLCPADWTLFIETSLNVSKEHVKRLASLIDYWIVDIKDVNDRVYRRYTGTSNRQALRNLKYLIKCGLADKIMVRVPDIPGYNTKEDVDESVNKLNVMGIKNIQHFQYEKCGNPEVPLMGVPVTMGRPKSDFLDVII